MLERDKSLQNASCNCLEQCIILAALPGSKVAQVALHPLEDQTLRDPAVAVPNRGCSVTSGRNNIKERPDGSA